MEVEITSADAGKIDRYGNMGVRELWLLRHRGGRDLPEEFLALRPRAEPRKLTASKVVSGLTPADIREAVTSMRLSVTHDERAEAVARIVRRRQRSSVRVREEGPSYADQ